MSVSIIAPYIRPGLDKMFAPFRQALSRPKHPPLFSLAAKDRLNADQVRDLFKYGGKLSIAVVDRGKTTATAEHGWNSIRALSMTEREELERVLALDERAQPTNRGIDQIWTFHTSPLPGQPVRGACLRADVFRALAPELSTRIRGAASPTAG
jgi:hypothetical protein